MFFSLMMQSGPGDFFSLIKVLVCNSYGFCESITSGISFGSPMILSRDRVSLCCCGVTYRLLACSLLYECTSKLMGRFYSLY